MNESYSARKKGRGSKTDFRANLKNYSVQISSYVIKMTSEKDRFSETERFIKLWKGEESL